MRFWPKKIQPDKLVDPGSVVATLYFRDGTLRTLTVSGSLNAFGSGFTRYVSRHDITSLLEKRFVRLDDKYYNTNDIYRYTIFENEPVWEKPDGTWVTYS